MLYRYVINVMKNGNKYCYPEIVDIRYILFGISDNSTEYIPPFILNVTNK